VVGRSCRTPAGPSGDLTAAAARGAAHPLSGRADALYVVNDALGSFLLRANEVIDQVPMSACGPQAKMEATISTTVAGARPDIARSRPNRRF